MFAFTPPRNVQKLVYYLMYLLATFFMMVSLSMFATIISEAIANMLLMNLATMMFGMSVIFVLFGLMAEEWQFKPYKNKLIVTVVLTFLIMPRVPY